MFKKITFFLFVLFSLFGTRVTSQSFDLSSVKIAFHGFVRGDAAFDSRLNVEAREGFVILYPLKPDLDANGADINAVPNFNQWGMTSRVNLTATGPDILGAKVKGFVEGDFTGPSNPENNAFRLRHGYIEMKWVKASILVGQYWSPLDVPEMLPRVLALNTGAPFRSFTRSPMIKVAYTPGKFDIIAVAYAQRDYVSPGPSGGSVSYLRNALVPNLHLMIQYHGQSLFAGAGVDYKQLRPRLVTDSLFKADELVRSVSLHVFGKYTDRSFQIKTQVILGQNLSDHLMTGGYAVEKADSLDNRTYVNLNNLSLWADLTYDYRSVRLGLYGGYVKNLGTGRDAKGPFYGRGDDIDYIYRVAPRIDVNILPLQFTFEVEYTVAAYGISDNRFNVSQTDEISNIRLQAAVIYMF
ncbi:MAG TPA: hypothetical protein DEO70_13945 [Bacteroidales bacterium]|nr:MAG: hypothetical protein A2X11_13730 [Bacteroidetes bacterium GWE2_42_24]OFY30120.1 MAG: hypothetical protein A2X09_14045 [Bacteroidetes bacterium GWF2_43_11]PKP27519.1 MAG: hypothetical protein CVU06_01790 [Bacteroidetes bacterium HGW-Bacteroidetes-22]HBZ67931.1 hypothetical protein [Bacteroidales bacterium]